MSDRRPTIPGVSDTANPNPDWYPDPTGRFELRYWDGGQWTEHVSSAGQPRTDPLPGGPAQPSSTGDRPGFGATEPTAEPAPAVAERVAVAAADPDWYPDPTGRYEQRYWDGSHWTEHVTVAGQQGVDPLPEEPVGGATEATAQEEPASTPAAEAPSTEEPESTPAAEPAAEPDSPVTAAGTEPEMASPGSTAEDGGSGAATGGPAVAGPPADWYPDPSGRYELRYWDGGQWTEHASTGGQQVVDPLT
jgi:hypothetical protein